MDDLTKLRDKWRELAAQESVSTCAGRVRLVGDAAFEVGKAVYMKCADELDAALAAVPQELVEEVREAVLCDKLTWTESTIYWKGARTPAEGADAAIRSVLAARMPKENKP